jgi:hypothetical protein
MDEHTKSMNELVERVARLEKAMVGTVPEPVVKKEKAVRKPNAFNIYMKEEISKLKVADSALTHQQAFIKAAANWSAKKAEVPVVAK